MSSRSRTVSAMGRGGDLGLSGDGARPAHAVTWVLVADGARAQVYVKPPQDSDWDLHPVRHMHFKAESARAYETGGGTAATVHESATPARHMSEPKLDVRDKVKQDLARRVAEAVNAARKTGRFDDLIVIAAPATLGYLRAHLDGDVPVRAELARDLTDFDTGDLKAHLAALLPAPADASVP